jgi:uncharacterized protein (DUF4415 family)
VTTARSKHSAPQKPNPGSLDEDAPELTDAELAEMRPAAEVLPADFYALVTRHKHERVDPGNKSTKKRR